MKFDVHIFYGTLINGLYYVDVSQFQVILERLIYPNEAIFVRAKPGNWPRTRCRLKRGLNIDIEERGVGLCAFDRSPTIRRLTRP